MNPAPLAGLTGIARRLVAEGALSEGEARKAVDDALRQKIPIGAWLVENSLVGSDQVALASSAEFGIPLFDIQALDLAQIPLRLVREDLITKHKALPLFKRGNRLFVGVSDPTNLHALDEIKFQSNHIIEPILIDEQQIERAIEQAFNATATSSKGSTTPKASRTSSSGRSTMRVATAATTRCRTTTRRSSSSSTRCWSTRSSAAPRTFTSSRTSRISACASAWTACCARWPRRRSSSMPRISSRLKVMSGLDIAERRVPQDGRIKLNLSKTKSIDFRVSTCPTLFGEKIVLRILDAAAARLGIDKLGYEEDQKKLFLDAIDKPYGMVLVTGPTGSGKTVSLYTALNILNTEGRNISTVEDPVEIRVPGINQVQMNVKRGMTFAAALRSFLRQDPDVIMVGEIRDLETAEIAIKAAQTGHMVLSTLHTNDAPQTIARLMNMGIAPYNITSSVTLVIAQRLARRLHDCKKPLQLPAAALLAEGFTQAEIDAGMQIFDAVGCSGCNEGYKGRTGIYQVHAA